jgi:hypothetical protein
MCRMRRSGLAEMHFWFRCYRNPNRSNPATVRRRSSIARPSHPICVVSQLLCVRQPVPSQIMCAGKDHLLRVGLFIIARRYTYVPPRPISLQRKGLRRNTGWRR